MATPAIPFAERLRDPDASNRMAALGDALKPGGPAATAPEVAPLLNDVDPNIRQVAVVLLGQIGASAVPALASALDQKQPLPVRIFAASGLVRIGPAASSAVDALGKCLGDPDPGLKLNSALALSRIGPPALPVLRRALSVEVSAPAAARGLGWMGRIAAPATDDLKRTAVSGPVSARLAASAALVNVTGDPASGLPALIAVMSAKNTEPAARAEAAERTGELQEQGRGAIAALRSCLDDAAALVRASAALALARVKSVEPETCAALTRLLKDADPQVRANAALALERFGPAGQQALPALKELAAGADPSVRLIAAGAIRSIEGPPASIKTSPPGTAAPRIAARTAAEVPAPIAPEAKALLKGAMTPRQFVDVLIENGRYQDAILFLAQALGRPEAIWWACVCAREAVGPNPPPAIAGALGAAEKWVSTQTEETRHAALAAAQAADMPSPAGSAALAAFLSGGSVAPQSMPPVLPPEGACAQAVAGAVIMAALAKDPEKVSERLRTAVVRGLEVAEGNSRWR